MEIRNKYQVKEDICYILPANSRQELSRPYGILFLSLDPLVDYLSNFSRVISVGDVVTESLLSRNIIPYMSIIDGKTKRTISKSLNFATYKRIISIINEPALIRMSTMKLLKNLLEHNDNEKTLVIVDGEEDLLVIPIVLYGKEGDIVIYGQPNAGVVALEVCELMKWRVKDLFSKFIVKKC